MCWFDRTKTKKELKKEEERNKKILKDYKKGEYKEILPVKLTKSERKKLELFWIYFFRDRAGSGDGHGLDAYPKKDRKKMLKKIQLYEEAFKNKFF